MDRLVKTLGLMDRNRKHFYTNADLELGHLTPLNAPTLIETEPDKPGDYEYLVAPYAEERAKILGPTPTQRLLEQILFELQYNPDASSRVQEARSRFEESLSKKRPKI